MTESQLSICTWADATFGPASGASIAARALVEMAELVTACVNGEPAARIGEEIADVVIVLARLGRALGCDVVRLFEDEKAHPCHDQTAMWHVASALEELAKAISLLDVDRMADASRFLWRTVRDLAELAARVAIDLPSAIDAKMAVNRARRWTLDGHGHGTHVKELTP